MNEVVLCPRMLGCCHEMTSSSNPNRAMTYVHDDQATHHSLKAFFFETRTEAGPFAEQLSLVAGKTMALSFLANSATQLHPME